MGRLIYAMNVSLDGRIATADGGLDWATVDDELHAWFNEQARGISLSLYGRRMYELMAGYWPTAAQDPDTNDVMREYAGIWARTPKVVFSRTLDRVMEGCRLISGDAPTIVRELLQEQVGDVDVSGADLAGQLIAADLVDRYQLVVHPVVLGEGPTFWPVGLDVPRPLRQLATRTFTGGAILLEYGRP
jgi:dihydrofolate reductase